MHESGFNRMIKENIFSFFPFNKNTGKKIELLRRSPEFIEILFNGVNKTTLSYLKDENNKVIPQTDFPYEDIDTTQSIINAFDKGIDCFFAVAFEYGINAKVYEPEELLYLLSRLIEVPTKEECFNLGQLQHDEGYGSILIERIIEDKHLTSIKDISVEKAYSRFIKNLSYKINEVPWIQGVITSINENYIKQMRGLEVKSVNSDAINSLLEVLDENNHINEIYVYGAGQFLHELLPYLLHRNIVLKGILDTRANFSNFRFLDFEVKSLTDIDFEMEDTIIISSVVFATDITSLILDTIKNKNLKIMIINHYNGLIHL